MRSNILLIESKDSWYAGSLEYRNVQTQGDTREEARKNIGLIMGDMIMHDEAEPFDKEIDPMKYMKEMFSDQDYNKWILSDVNVADYLDIKDSSVAVRTNVSIKKGYKFLAKKRKINMSDFINKALAKELGTEF